MLVRAVEAALRRAGVGRGTLLVAVSGGVDSTVLCVAIHDLSQELALGVAIGHVHHGLRGEASDADQAAVQALGRDLGLEVHLARVAPESLREGRSSRDRPTLQEAARSLRYQALADLAEKSGARWIATGHNADDQAETVLLRLLRGAGPEGLGGIPDVSPDGRILRPLLSLPRDEIESFARKRCLSWREDASNQDDGYARNRLRRHWIPGLTRDFNPRLLRAVGDLAEAQRKETEWIASLVEQEAARRIRCDGEWLRIDASGWAALPEALARRLTRWLLHRCGRGRDVTRTHLARMQRFLTSGRSGSHIELPGGLRLERTREGFRLGPIADPGSRQAGVRRETAC
jgi:tRNA(Ile)-lysidine synthase